MLLGTQYYQLIYENATVRQIKSGSTEVLRMIYGAVRDPNWGTLTPQLLAESIVPGENEFDIKASLLYHHHHIQFQSDLHIHGKGDHLIFEMKGEALSDFKSCRIGLCVLHPIKECTGKTCLLVHPDGTSEESRFPDQVAAHQPMFDIAALQWKASTGLDARLNFYGEVFEMEDQRNWTDASYKTYGRPLEMPFPFEVEKGDKIEQKIELTLTAEPRKKARPESLACRVVKSRKYPMPELGASLSDRFEPLLPGEASLLKALPLRHLRLELKLFQNNWQDHIHQAIREIGYLKWSLFLVLYVSKEWENELATLKLSLEDSAEQVQHILLLGKEHLSEDPLFEAAFEILKSTYPNAAVGAGVNANFAELNRNRPASGKPDFINFALSPQLHAFDRQSLVENLEAQSYVLDSARKLFPGKALYVSSVSLKPRINVVATTDEPTPSSEQLPPHVDQRQNSIFAAQWLLGSLKYLAQSGANVVTLFETLGWAGFMQGSYPSPLPELFSAKAGDLFPIYTLLKELSGFDQVIYSQSNAPLRFESILLFDAQKTSKMLLTQFSTSEQTISLPGSGNWSSAKCLFSQKKMKINPGSIRLPPNEIVVLRY